MHFGRILEVKSVRADYMDDLAAKMNEMIQRGWQPHGAIETLSYPNSHGIQGLVFYQMMAKHEVKQNAA